MTVLEPLGPTVELARAYARLASARICFSEHQAPGTSGREVGRLPDQNTRICSHEFRQHPETNTRQIDSSLFVVSRALGER